MGRPNRSDFSTTEYVSTSREHIIKAPRTGRRDYLFIQNVSANDVYINNGTHSDASHGTVLGAGLFYERGSLGSQGVPQDDIYLFGSVAGNQQLNITEGISVV